VIDKDRARRHAGKGALLAEHHRAQVVIVAHAAEHEAGPGNGLAGCGRMPGLAGRVGKLFAPCLGLGRGAVVNGHGMTGARKMTRHGVAHDAQAKKGELVRGDAVITARMDAAGHETLSR
jgi:hypothetical protein